MIDQDDFDDPNAGFLAALWQVGTTRVRPYSRRLAILLGFGLLVILGVVLWESSQHPGGHVVTADAIPVVQAPATPWRAKPSDPGGMEIPYRDSTVFNALQPPAVGKTDNPPDVPAGDKVENLLAPPAQLVPKSKLFPEVKTVAPKLASTQETMNVPATTDSTAPPATAPPQSIVGAATADADADDFVPAGNAQTSATSATSATAPAAAAKAQTGYYVQLGAVASTAAAQASWKRAQSAYTELSDLPLHVEPVTLPHGILYRVQAGPVDQAQAHALCAAVTAKKPGGCIVVKH